MVPWPGFLVLLAAEAVGATTGAPVGDLFVKTSVPGARVFLDGTDTGQAAPVVLEQVPAGSHQVRVVAGCDVGEGSIRVEGGLVARLELTLAPGDGFLDVAYTPVGSRVTVDGAPVGVTPLLRLPLTCGEHRVEVSGPGRRAYVETIRLGLDQTVFLKGALGVYEAGRLAILVRPVDAEVRVDDRPVGVGPMTLDDVASGSHTVTARLAGYQDAATQVVVPNGGVGRAEILLLPVGQRPPSPPRGPIAWGHVGVDVGLTLATVGLGGLAWGERTRAADAYRTYKTLTYADDPERYYDTEVRRPETLSWILAGGAAASLAGAIAGWIWLPVVEPASGTAAVVATRRF